MKKFKLSINDNRYDVSIVDIEGNTATVIVNGKEFKVEVDKQIQKSKTPTLIRSRVEPSTDISKSIQRTAGPSAPKGVGFIKSPLPGTIIEIHVRKGDPVKIGTKLITLEAMKMENNINSDKEGIVTDIKVNPRDAVLEGDILIEIGNG